MYKVNLLTRDGASIAFDADPSDTLLEAAEKANIFPPASCREGACGTCRVTRKNGEVVHGAYSAAALAAADRDAGDILLCRSKACSDLELTAPFDRTAVGIVPVPERAARIVELSAAGAGAKRLVLRLEDDPTYGRAAEFLPGQFMQLSVPGTSIKRVYSLANTPNWDGTLEFYIRLQRGGAFSSYLAERARPEDLLTVHGPQGSFALDESSLAPRWFAAGGTGLAPMLSILRQMAEFGDARNCRLFFGVTTQAELFALKAIEELETALPSLVVTICVWKPDTDWRGFVGTPVQALAQALHAEARLRPDIYLCGPPALIEAAEAASLAAGRPRERIFAEKFAAA